MEIITKNYENIGCDKILTMWKLLILLFIPICGWSQSPKVKTVQLEKPEGSTYAFAQVEPSIAIHPKNQNIQIAGTVMDDYYYSTDGGTN